MRARRLRLERHGGPRRAWRAGAGGAGLLSGAPAALALTEPTGDLVDTAEIPGGGVLQLVRDGEDYEIVFEDEQLMNSWASRSEEALATLACAAVTHRPERVLIGGLGMGFTLGAALRTLPPTARVIVAELVPGVVAWARGPLAHIHGSSLDDPRVTLAMRDVHDLIAERGDLFDIILLDVDNGPDGLVTAANERLYCAWGLRAAHAALTPGGVLAVWSADPEPAFTDLLTVAGFTATEVRVGEGPAAHAIWVAVKSSRPAG